MASNVQSQTNNSERLFNIDRFRRMGGHVDTWTLMSESTIAKEIYARIITHGEQGFDQLFARVAEGKFQGLNLEWLARLGRILALQPGNEEFQKFARDSLLHSVPRLPANEATFPLRKTLAEIFFSEGDINRARKVVESDSQLREHYFGYLLADIYNPFLQASGEDFYTWADLFNAPFSFYDMQPVSVDPDARNPFNSMTAEVPKQIEEGTLVSVILTTFNPDPGEIAVSVRSILRQSWRNLELLLIDDGSQENSLPVLKALQEEDSRIRLIRLPTNSGTYRARNVGLREARGKYITGQDTDDWSHPERIARQVRTFCADPTLAGVMTSANRMNDNLVRSARGYNPHRRCEVSLMTHRDTALAIGGYLPVRKAADSEFRERLEAWTEAPAYTMPDPLYLIRMSDGSLSRSDFRPGWSHQARRSFWSAYKHWHHTATKWNLVIEGTSGGEALPFVPPPRISGSLVARSHSQLCFVCDWRADSFVQRAALDEIITALNAGVSVAILQLESPFEYPLSTRALIPPVQELVNQGSVRQVTTEEEATVELLIVRDPAVVDYGKEHRASFSPAQVLVVADDSMITAPPALWNYDPGHTQKMVETIFGVNPTWAVLNADNGTQFSELFGVPLEDHAYPLVIRDDSIRQRRRPFSTQGPVIGKTALNVESDWPEASLLELIYPTDGSADVRVLGDARGAIREMKERLLPASWIHFRRGEINAPVFWRSVEFLAKYDRRGGAKSITRDVLEAMAAGCVVITTPDATTVYADAVEGVAPSDARQAMTNLRADASRYDSMARRAKAFVRNRCAPDQYLEFLLKKGVEMKATAYS